MAGLLFHPADGLSGAGRDRRLDARRDVVAQVENIWGQLDTQSVGFAQARVDAHFPKSWHFLLVPALGSHELVDRSKW